MIDRAVFEKLALYKKHPYEAPPPLNLIILEYPSINMRCEVCKANQTFHTCGAYVDQVPEKRSRQNTERQLESGGSVNVVWYLCTSCDQYGYGFLLRVAEDRKSITKVGQYPPWSIEPEPGIGDALGDHLKEYKKGLICESQGFGIGAFSYYRRIVETLIDSLLDDIGDLIKGETDHAEYMKRRDP